MATMMTHHEYNNPTYNAHKNMDAQYTRQMWVRFTVQCGMHTQLKQKLRRRDLLTCNAHCTFFPKLSYSIFFQAGHGPLNRICHPLMGGNWKILLCEEHLFVLIFHFYPESFQIGNWFGILHFGYFELLISESRDTWLFCRTIGLSYCYYYW